MKGQSAAQKGFTLIEILIVLAVLAVFAAVVVPNVSGFLSNSKAQSYKADQRTLQAAVDGWRSDTSQRTGNTWPTINSGTIISIPQLVTSGYIRDTAAVGSANTTYMVGATNSPSGTYTWTVNTTSGVVSSSPAYSTGVYP